MSMCKYDCGIVFHTAGQYYNTNLDLQHPIWMIKRTEDVAVWPREGTFSGVRITPGGTYDVKGQSLPEPLAQSYPYVLSAISQPNCLVAQDKCLQLERAAKLEREYQKKSQKGRQ